MITATTSPGDRVTADRTEATALSWPIYAVLFASTSVVLGVTWDISWHRTIGRDTFWTPAHLAIYLGGVVSGLTCAWLALRTTFAGQAEDRAATVRFWGFRAPFGAWVSIWGAIAMLTSAPFDDWWHNAYGLDVKIISPPHMVLAAGIGAIQAGAMLMALASQNRAGGERCELNRLFLHVGAGETPRRGENGRLRRGRSVASHRWRSRGPRRRPRTWRQIVKSDQVDLVAPTVTGDAQ
jgi:hypothetical protein